MKFLTFRLLRFLASQKNEDEEEEEAICVI